MKKFWWSRCVVATLAAWALVAHADLDITITEGIDDARPVAVLPFSFQGYAAPAPSTAVSQAPFDMAAIIASDLERSGKFRALPVADMPETPNTSSGLHLASWRAKGSEAVVVGRIVESAPGQYQIAFELVDVFKSKDAPAAGMQLKNGELTQMTATFGPTVLEAKQHLVQAAGYRMHAHHIADWVYEKLTGERGAFATYITYVTIERGSKQPYKLVVADSDDYNPRVILPSNEPIMAPAWSRDGKKLAYVSFEKGRSQIFVQDIYTGERQSVAAFAGINDAPAWSPDGTKLALTLSYEDNPEIYIYDLATRTTKRLTNSSAIETEPSWSPDGQWLVYTSDRGGKPQIYRMHLATGKENRVTFEGDYNAGASYSPDGKRLVLVNRSNGQFHIAMQDLQTNLLQVLTDTQLDQSASFSPNGSMVIYATLFRGQQILAAVSSDGRFKARLQARKGEVRAPAWSPYLD